MDDLRSELREAVIAAEGSEISLSDDGAEVLDQLVNAACDALEDCGDGKAIQDAIIRELEDKLEEAEIALQRLEAVQGMGG